VHMNLDHESMKKNSLKGHNNLIKLNARHAAYEYKVFEDKSSYGFGRTLPYQRGALQRVFQIFK